MKICRSLFTLIIALPLLAAEPQQPALITLEVLVTQALADNPELKFYEAEIEAAREAQASLYELNALRGRPIAERLVIADVTMEFAELPGAEEFIRRAARGNFELRQREIELAQQGFKLRLAENEAWPSISLGPQFSEENAGREKESFAGVGVSVPLPLWNRNQGGVQTANARLLQARLRSK